MAKIMSEMKEVDRLATETKDVSDRIIEVKHTIVGSVAAVKDGMSGDVTALLKLVPMLTDSKKFANDCVDLSMECVNKSIEMAGKCAAAKKSIPCVGCMGKAPKVQPDEEDGPDPEPVDVSEDIAALEKARDAFEKGSVLTMVKEGAAAITSLEEKLPVIQTIVDAIIRFCRMILKITGALANMSVKALVKQLPQILRCLDLSAMVQQFAEELKRFVEMLRDVFEAMGKKVDSLNPMKAAGAAAGAAMGAVSGGLGKVGGMFG